MVLRNNPAQLHVGFNAQEVLEPDPPWLSRSRFKHEASELGMKGWQFATFAERMSGEARSAMDKCLLRLQVRHAATILAQLFVLGQSLEHFSLAQR